MRVPGTELPPGELDGAHCAPYTRRHERRVRNGHHSRSISTTPRPPPYFFVATRTIAHSSNVQRREPAPYFLLAGIGWTSMQYGPEIAVAIATHCRGNRASHAVRSAKDRRPHRLPRNNRVAKPAQSFAGLSAAHSHLPFRGRCHETSTNGFVNPSSDTHRTAVAARSAVCADRKGDWLCTVSQTSMF